MQDDQTLDFHCPKCHEELTQQANRWAAKRAGRAGRGSCKVRDSKVLGEAMRLSWANRKANGWKSKKDKLELAKNSQQEQ